MLKTTAVSPSYFQKHSVTFTFLPRRLFIINSCHTYLDRVSCHHIAPSRIHLLSREISPVIVLAGPRCLTVMAPATVMPLYSNAIAPLTGVGNVLNKYESLYISLNGVPHWSSLEHSCFERIYKLESYLR